MSEDIKRSIRVRGAIKIVAGIIMMPLSFILVFIGYLVRLIGGLSLLAGIAAKIASILAKEDERRLFWQERAQKLVSFGSVAFVSGVVLTIPFLPGVLVMFEGVYNIVAIESSCGIISVSNMLSKFMGDLVIKGVDKKQKPTAFTEVVKEEVVVQKKPAKKASSKEDKA
jgi:hypothetical protein